MSAQEFESVRRHVDSTAFEAEIAQLESEGFVVNRFDCAEWADEAGMHRDLQAKLPLPDYYGRNLDAMNDSLIQMIDDAVPKRALAFVNFTDLQRLDSRPSPRAEVLSEAMLGIFDWASKFHTAYGKTLVTLVLEGA
jgi:RNAse (barnase) inhibitor barstar